MTIERVILKNFKTHRTTEVALSPLTVLVGPNSVGKTSVLEAIHLVAGAISTDRLRFLDYQDGARWIRKGTDTLSATLWLEAQGPTFIELVLDATHDRLRREIRWSRDGTGGSASSTGPNSLSTGEASSLFQETLGGTILLRLDPVHLAAPSTLEIGERTTTLSASGEGLAGVLSVMRLFREDVYRSIVDELKRIVPSLLDVRLKQGTYWENRIERDEQGEPGDRRVEFQGIEIRFDFVGGADVRATEVSEGTLIALGVLTAARLEQLPRVILLDDIERALHPRAQRELISALRTMLKTVPGLQILATSHSPYIIDAFQPEEVVVFALREDGSAAARRLSEHPDVRRAMEVLTTGEFLASREENWILESPMENASG